MASDIHKSQLEELAQVIQHVYGGFTHAEEAQRQKLRKMAEAVHGRILQIKIPHCTETCLNRFIDGEMDYQSLGMRGPGRSTDVCPRFAALHRETVRGLSEVQRDLLRARIRTHILCGYVFTEIVMGVTSRANPLPTGRDLYEKMWMQLYYTNQFNVEPQSGTNDSKFLGLWHEATCEMLHNVLIDFGGAWKDEDPMICTAYFNGGVRLRFLEARPLTDVDVRDLLTGGAFSKLLSTNAKGSPGAGCMAVVSAVSAGVMVLLIAITTLQHLAR